MFYSVEKIICIFCSLIYFFLASNYCVASVTEVRYFVGMPQKAAVGDAYYATCTVREGHELEDLWEDMLFWRTALGPGLGIQGPERIDESELSLPPTERDRTLLRELYNFTRRKSVSLVPFSPLDASSDREISEEDDSFDDEVFFSEEGGPPSSPFLNTGGGGSFTGNNAPLSLDIFISSSREPKETSFAMEDSPSNKAYFSEKGSPPFPPFLSTNGGGSLTGGNPSPHLGIFMHPSQGTKTSSQPIGIRLYRISLSETAQYTSPSPISPYDREETFDSQKKGISRSPLKQTVFVETSPELLETLRTCTISLLDAFAQMLTLLMISTIGFSFMTRRPYTEFLGLRR